MRRSILKPSSLLELSIQVASSSPAPLSRGPPSAVRDKKETKIKVGKRLRFELNVSSSLVLLASNAIRDTGLSLLFSLSNGTWTLYQLFTELLRTVEYASSQPVAYHVKAVQVKNPMTILPDSQAQSVSRTQGQASES